MLRLTDKSTILVAFYNNTGDYLSPIFITERGERSVAFPDHEYVSLHDRSELVTEVGHQVCLEVIINHV